MCRAWRGEAHSLLWEELYIWTEAPATRLIQSPLFGCFTTHKLSISGAEMSASHLHMIVGGVVNLKELYLYFAEIGMLLWSPNLRRLGSLCLQGVTVAPASRLPASHISFPSLQYLCFKDYTRQAISKLQHFFKTSTSITELAIISDDPQLDTKETDDEEDQPSPKRDLDDTVSLFASLARHLHIVNFTSILPSEIPTFARCSNLQELDELLGGSA